MVFYLVLALMNGEHRGVVGAYPSKKDAIEVAEGYGYARLNEDMFDYIGDIDFFYLGNKEIDSPSNTDNRLVIIEVLGEDL